MLSEQEVKNYKKQLKSGVPEGEIKNEILSKGYSEEAFKKVFVVKEIDMRNWYLIFGALFFVIGFFLFIKNNSYFLLVLGGALLYCYYVEEKKYKLKNKN